MLAAITNNSDIGFALALVGLILALVTEVQSRLVSILGWAVASVSLALVLIWWP